MFNWKDYLDLAQKLINPAINIQSDEACWRSAVSRAYYASFHKARQFAYANGFQKPRNPALEHSMIPDFLKKQSSFQLKEVGNDLNRLKANRQKCDYEGNVSGISKLAKASLMIANKIHLNIP